MLVVEGEELMGAKQNRIVNVTLLVASNTEIVIPLDVGDVDKSDLSVGPGTVDIF